jgi:Flp pilus assembly protein TadG
MRRLLKRRERGQSLVEFALVIPIFVLVLMGIFDLGRAVYAYNTANNAAREAARLAIVDQTQTDVEQRAMQHGVGLGLSVSDITIDYRSSNTPDTASSCATLQIGCLANVRIDYGWTAATPIIGNLVGTINIVGESQFPVEAVCVSPADSPCPKGE